MSASRLSLRDTMEESIFNNTYYFQNATHNDILKSNLLFFT
jgi:hypothetical protein